MSKKIAIVAAASASGEKGGAERFYDGLRAALCAQGVDVEVVSAVPDESSFETILRSYLRFYDLDFSAYDGIISTKAPAYMSRHPNHVCYLVHTMRRFYDMFDLEFPSASEVAREQRRQVLEMDTVALSSPNVRRVYVIGEEVRDRLQRYNGIRSEVLYPAGTLPGLRRDGAFDYLFMPGRLHRWKRVGLVISAMAYVKSPVRLIISGSDGEEQRLRELARGDSRIEFVGRIGDEELIEYYANALAIPFVPCWEDFGLVAIEAFQSGKPVITCCDSGEPARLTSRYDAGLICDPIPESVAAAIDALYNAPDIAKRLGASGSSQVGEISWEPTARALVSALGFPIEKQSAN